MKPTTSISLKASARRVCKTEPETGAPILRGNLDGCRAGNVKLRFRPALNHGAKSNEQSEEAARVAEALSYHITDTLPEPDYDEFAEMAARATACPAGLINFLDDNSLWSKSRYGVPARSEHVPGAI